jgi:hypothetical protein
LTLIVYEAKVARIHECMVLELAIRRNRAAGIVIYGRFSILTLLTNADLVRPDEVIFSLFHISVGETALSILRASILTILIMLTQLCQLGALD